MALWEWGPSISFKPVMLLGVTQPVAELAHMLTSFTLPGHGAYTSI